MDMTLEYGRWYPLHAHASELQLAKALARLNEVEWDVDANVSWKSKSDDIRCMLVEGDRNLGEVLVGEVDKLGLVDRPDKIVSLKDRN
jgi:hypothetical protein